MNSSVKAARGSCWSVFCLGLTFARVSVGLLRVCYSAFHTWVQNLNLKLCQKPISTIFWKCREDPLCLKATLCSDTSELMVTLCGWMEAAFGMCLCVFALSPHSSWRVCTSFSEIFLNLCCALSSRAKWGGGWQRQQHRCIRGYSAGNWGSERCSWVQTRHLVSYCISLASFMWSHLTLLIILSAWYHPQLNNYGGNW